MTRRHVVALVGLPGSGKTTALTSVETLPRWYGFGLGDALRVNAAQDTMLASTLANGQLAPEQTVISLVRAGLSAAGSRNLVVDGFPRHTGQIEDADAIFGHWSAILLSITTETALRRLSGRRDLSTVTGIARPEDGPGVLASRLVRARADLDSLTRTLEERHHIVVVDAEAPTALVIGAIHHHLTHLS